MDGSSTHRQGEGQFFFRNAIIDAAHSRSNPQRMSRASRASQIRVRGTPLLGRATWAVPSRRSLHHRQQCPHQLSVEHPPPSRGSGRSAAPLPPAHRWRGRVCRRPHYDFSPGRRTCPCALRPGRDHFHFHEFRERRAPRLRPRRAQPLLPREEVRSAQPALRARRRYTLSAPPLLGNQLLPIASRFPLSLGLRHPASSCLPARRPPCYTSPPLRKIRFRYRSQNNRGLNCLRR